VGWWGIPWGPIFTVPALVTNLRGGIDVTESMLASLSPGLGSTQPMPARLDLGGGVVRRGACGYMNGPNRQSGKGCRQPLGSTA
jgi:hypothetical protein